MRKTRGFFSWALTSVLTVVSAFGIVALTTGNTVATTAAPTTTAATTAKTVSLVAPVAPVAHVVTFKSTYHDDSSNTSYQGDY